MRCLELLINKDTQMLDLYSSHFEIRQLDLLPLGEGRMKDDKNRILKGDAYKLEISVIDIMKPIRAFLAITLMLALTACGFHLRGQITALPFDSIHVTAPPGHSIRIDVERAIRVSTNAKVVKKPEKAQAILQILSAVNEKKILSLSIGGRVREFQLGYRISARLIDSQGAEIAPVEEINVTRVLPFLDEQVLAKAAEEEMLYKDMQSDAVQQIIRRIAAIKPHPSF
jgi:LPS-assembly lipoprotein